MQPLEKAINELSKAEFCCILAKNNHLYKAQGIGVKPLVTWLNDDIDFFADGAVADKVIGKAAALLLVLGKVAEVYGGIMSEAAVRVLTANNIPYKHGELVPFISNRTHDGICPLEKAVTDIDEPLAAFAAIKETIKLLMAQK